jgi:CheY-like chemotaxis protein
VTVETGQPGAGAPPSARAIAHDLNNLFAVIIGMSELLSAAGARDPHLAMIARTIDDAAERGAQITQHMLAEARQGAAQAGNLDVDEAAKETDTGTAEACRGGDETILVVEDAGTIRRTVVNMLESLGYAVRQAEDGHAALELLKLPGKIDLLFTDMVLPQGMSGRDLVDQARAYRPDLRVLFTSGYSEHSGDADASPPGPLLSKPYRRGKLAAAVRTLLDGETA